MLDREPVWSSYLGEGVRIAILGAVDPDHPDLAENDARGTLGASDPRPSLVVGGPISTLIARLAAADRNGDGLAGMAPDAEVVSYIPGVFEPAIEIYLTLPYRALLEQVDLDPVFDPDARGGRGTIAVTMGQGDTNIEFLGARRARRTRCSG